MPLGMILFLSFLLVCLSPPSDAYDALDPRGNITIRWDVRSWEDGILGYTAVVSIFNNQRYRHIEKPGWQLGWTWANKEVIWDARGAEAIEQGNCSRFHGSGASLPHCCMKKPVFVDLLPDAPYNYRVANCCRGGLLSSTTQEPSLSLASFQLTVGDAMHLVPNKTTDNQTTYTVHGLEFPRTFHLSVPGYTCGPASDAPPTKFVVNHGRRKTQALKTWKVICTYSAMEASPAPSCCVSLSAFYNDTIVECPRCSCGCQGTHPTIECVRDEEEAPMLQLPDEGGIKEVKPVVACSPHMCPIRVHWHVKLNYKEYWRVKVTVTNLNLVKNYSRWNLVVQHPNLENLTEVFSFKYQPLGIYPQHNDSGVFWGIPYYNDKLLQRGDMGNVQTELLLRKDPQQFTFRAGWAFPRRIYFNGEQCVMPPPDMYPRLPNAAWPGLSPCFTPFLSLFVFFFFFT